MTFTVYWYDGHKEVVHGETISKALTNHGYSGGATYAIDTYHNGESEMYTWNKETRNWDRNWNIK